MSDTLENQEKLDKQFATRVEDAPITRLEIIDDKGRAYTNYNVRAVEFLLQDGNKTLKIFVKSKAENVDINTGRCWIEV